MGRPLGRGDHAVESPRPNGGSVPALARVNGLQHLDARIALVIRLPWNSGSAHRRLGAAGGPERRAGPAVAWIRAANLAPRVHRVPAADVAGPGGERALRRRAP